MGENSHNLVTLLDDEASIVFFPIGRAQMRNTNKQQ
jgi:hypothetical protein